MTPKIILPLLASALFISVAKINAQSTSASNALTGTAPNPTQYLGSSNGFDVPFKTGGVERMRIIHSSGNTAMPNGNINIGPVINSWGNYLSKVTINAALTVNNSADNLVGFAVAKQINSSYSRGVFFVPHLDGWSYNRLSQNGDAGIFFTDGGNGRTSTGNRNYDAGFVIASFWDDYYGMRITSTGNVGIGTPLTSNPNNYRLAVNGTIGAKAIKVETTSTTWPDYVFENEYKLKTLAELEHFVNTNKHLPNVPSACEVEDHGIDVANMDAKLLEKIEELSLYIIEQDKRIIEQNKRIEALEKNIKETR